MRLIHLFAAFCALTPACVNAQQASQTRTAQKFYVQGVRAVEKGDHRRAIGFTRESLTTLKAFPYPILVATSDIPGEMNLLEKMRAPSEERLECVRGGAGAAFFKTMNRFQADQEVSLYRHRIALAERTLAAADPEGPGQAGVLAGVHQHEEDDDHRDRDLEDR